MSDKQFITKAYSLYNLKKYEEAITMFKKAIEIDSLDLSYYNNCGYSLYNLNKYEEAITMYKKAIEINFQNVKYFNNWEILYTI